MSCLFLPGYLKDNYDISIMDGFIALRMNAYEALKDLLAPLGEFIENNFIVSALSYFALYVLVTAFSAP